MISFFHTVLYIPIYNLLIFLVDVIPGGDIGLAVIAATIIVKVVIMPLSFAALRTSRAVKAIEPELKTLKEEYKDDKEGLARETFAIYKKYGINPFAGILTLFIQFPIVITLYWVFRTESLPGVDASLLYSFIHAPDTASPLFLGLILITSSSLILAVLVGITSYIQAVYALPLPAKPEPGAKPNMQADIGRAMALQMRYILPILTAVIAYASAALALYFITSNLLSIFQEYIVRLKKLPTPSV
ncbi:MAG: 60 kDa inner rane insertion protein preprotein translocase subunit YidC [Parcubacteria group bacterium]|nr:60 kDa inner rane insertion protein preprotein translocase subunit YidC [Parcubacteria group bacterium]